MKPRLPKDAWIYLVFLALVCIFFFDTLFLGKVLLTRDTFADFIPRLEFAGTAYRNFEVPLWNTQTGCGHPFFADPYMGAAYPPNAVFYFLPAAWAYRLTLVFHFALAGSGVIALARLWGFRPSAALFAAIGFVFGTHTVAMAEFFNALFPLSWCPLIVYLTALLYARFLSRPSAQPWPRVVLRHWTPIAALAAALAFCYLAGNPQYLAFALLLAGGCLVCRFIHDRKPAPFAATTLAIGASGIVALLLAAPHLLPFIELLGHSFRSAAIDPGFDQGSVNASLLLTFVLPFLFGAPGGPDAHWADSILEYQLGAFYVGILPLIAAVFALGAFRKDAGDNARWFRTLAVALAACAAGAILMAAGKYLPVYALMLDVVPGLEKLRWPSKFMFLATFAIPLLGALGFHLLLARKEKKATAFKLEWAALILFLAFAALLVTAGDTKETFTRLVGPSVELSLARLTLFQRDLVTALVFIGAAVAVFTLLLKAKNARHLRVLEFAVVAIAFVNVAIIGRRVHPVSEDDVFAYKPQIWKTLLTVAPPDPHWRIYSNYVFQAFSLYGVSDSNTFKLAKKASVGETWLPSGIPRVCNSALSISRYYDFYESIRAAPPEVGSKLIDMLNVRFVVGGPPWNELVQEGIGAELSVYPREERLPRAFLTAAWRAPADFATGLRAIASPGFDLRSEILLEPASGGGMPALQPGPAQRGAMGEVGGIRYDWNRVEMSVSAARPCLLVLNDTWYPGWRASVNGEDRPIFRANLLFRAVEIPAGESAIVFEYRPASWRTGLFLAGMAILLLGAGFAARRFSVPENAASS